MLTYGTTVVFVDAFGVIFIDGYIVLFVVLIFVTLDSFYEALTYETLVELFADIGVTFVIFAEVFIVG